MSLFGRRRPLSKRQRLRGYLWPSCGFRRMGLYYWRRVQRLSGSPYQIAIGFALGAATSMTPLLGFHVGIAVTITYLLRGNVIAAIIGTAAANPWTLPLIWASSYELGQRILGHEGGHLPATDLFSFAQLWARLQTLLLPMLVGSLPLALVVGTGFYLIVFYAIRSVRHARALRIQARHAERMRAELDATG